MTARIPSEILLNLTPYNIIVYPEDGSSLILYPKTGVSARLHTKHQKKIDELSDGAPVFEPQVFVGINPKTPNLGEHQRGVIVTMPVAEWLAVRKFRDWGEVYTADTGPNGAVKAEDGTIIGTKRLNRYI
jgi:hypothetical protein